MAFKDNIMSWPFNIFLFRLAESPEVDSDSSPWRNAVQAEELLQTVESSTSTESSLVEGKYRDPVFSENVA